MNKQDKIPQQVSSGKSDANIRFDDLRNLLLRFGFVERTRGSHHIFRKAGVEERINLQRDDDKANPIKCVKCGIYYADTIWQEKNDVQV